MKTHPIPKRLRKLVLDAYRRHAWNIGVSHFSGDIAYMKEDQPQKENGGWVAADINVSRRYLTAKINIYPHGVKEWRENGDAAMERIIAHETAHIATQHMFDMAVATYKDEGETHDAWETLTEVIGQLSLKLAEAKK